MNFVIWDAKDEGNSCVLLPPGGIARDWELYEGVPRAATFPPDAFFRMSDAHPRNIGLTDNLINLSELAVVSERLKELLEGKSLASVEYLPVTIRNHKGRAAPRRYFILHATSVQDCLDVPVSGCTHSHMVPTDIVAVERLVIDPARVDPAVALFRIKDFGSPLLIRRGLAEELDGAGLRGLSFVELDAYEP
jgi:hypothetical protein